MADVVVRLGPAAVDDNVVMLGVEPLFLASLVHCINVVAGCHATERWERELAGTKIIIQELRQLWFLHWLRPIETGHDGITTKTNDVHSTALLYCSVDICVHDFEAHLIARLTITLNRTETRHDLSE